MEKETPLLECVPNFSEGRDQAVIDAIADSIRQVSGVKLLDIDPGYAAHRTVMTFLGPPEAVCEAAFRAMRTATERIDMSRHVGTHPRFGATDVCPLIPVRGLDLSEVVSMAQALGRRVGEELDYPVWLYEAAASKPENANLAHVRKGEYEALPQKLTANPSDFGPSDFRPNQGATALGARKFLIAYNINLDTDSVAVAKAIAAEVRESGRVIIENGERKRAPGLLPAVKAIGWRIEDFDKVQISMNLTDIDRTPVHTVFDAVKALAEAEGVRVTGSELVGMAPLRVFSEAAAHYGVPARQVAEVWGLSEVKPFDYDRKVLEVAYERA